jgi:hypothetical protein
MKGIFTIRQNPMSHTWAWSVNKLLSFSKKDKELISHDNGHYIFIIRHLPCYD